MRYDADVIVINLGTNDASAMGDINFNEDFSNAVVEWVKELLSYNPDAKVLLTYGMINKHEKIILAYETAVQKLQNEGYNNVYYYTYEGTFDGIDHPGRADHASNGKYLANKIKQILDL